MRSCGLLTLLLAFLATGCSTAPVTNLLDHFAPSRYEATNDMPRKPRVGGDELPPPSVFPVEPRGGGRRVGLGDPVPELASPFPPK